MPTIRDDDIAYAGENSLATYYRIANQITIRMCVNSKNERVWLCLTCRKPDCIHSKAVERWATPRTRDDAA